jgi:uncharacterized protein YjbJ (UPF0337 family)
LLDQLLHDLVPWRENVSGLAIVTLSPNRLSTQWRYCNAEKFGSGRIGSLTLHQYAAARGTTVLLCALTSDTVEKEERMDREHAKGAADKGKGATKGTAGKVRDDKKLQGKGKSDKRKGLPENSNLNIAEEEKKRWETAVGGT